MWSALPEGRLTFRFSVAGIGNSPVIVFGGQPDALLAPERGNAYRFPPYQRLPCVKGDVEMLFDF